MKQLQEKSRRILEQAPRFAEGCSIPKLRGTPSLETQPSDNFAAVFSALRIQNNTFQDRVTWPDLVNLLKDCNKHISVHSFAPLRPPPKSQEPVPRHERSKTPQ